MLFKFLRQYFRDDEFEANKAQLAESKALLTEYRGFIQDQKSASEEEEKKKVDPDFLVMIWASIGLALTLGVEAASNFPKVNSSSLKDFGVSEITWLIIAMYVIFYVVYNGIFAISLTFDYAKLKDDDRYQDFAKTLFAGIILLFIGVIVIALFGTN
ncbi:MAG: hypothetical protein H6753_07180 [Candidatus Omnitrophica bacterium]|nr:hypothetical protein [Candidatus Omnitrophota bacterium]